MAHTENTPSTTTAWQHLDVNGVELTVGDRVELLDAGAGNYGTVAILEGPCPGSRTTREGRPTVYVHVDGGHRVYTADRVRLEEEYMDEGPTCPSCDGSISPTAAYCPCGAVLVELADPFEGMTFEERMTAEVHLENEERAAMGAPLIPVL